jgi:uridine phosphorylase
VPTHLRPTAPIAPDAILPGDPKRAMELATALFEKPLMSNLSRGLWGYHGRSGTSELTVQSTGIGGPSAAVVVGELAGLGVQRAIRVGTCIGLDPELSPGAVVVVRQALAADGVGRALHPRGPLLPDPELTAALAAATGPEPGAIVASSDLYEHPDAGRRAEWRADGAVAVDLSAAAVLAVGERVGVAVACGLVVAESAGDERLSDAELDAALLQLGRIAGGILDERAQDPASS